MLPFLRHGDVVTLTPASPVMPRVGDIVAYAPWPGQLFVHRVVACHATTVVVRGDARSTSDAIPLSAVLAVATAVARGGRRWCLHTRWRRLQAGAAVHLMRWLAPLVSASVDVWLARRAA